MKNLFKNLISFGNDLPIELVKPDKLNFNAYEIARKRLKTAGVCEVIEPPKGFYKTDDNGKVYIERHGERVYLPQALVDSLKRDGRIQ